MLGNGSQLNASATSRLRSRPLHTHTAPLWVAALLHPIFSTRCVRRERATRVAMFLLEVVMGPFAPHSEHELLQTLLGILEKCIRTCCCERLKRDNMSDLCALKAEVCSLLGLGLPGAAYTVQVSLVRASESMQALMPAPGPATSVSGRLLG